MRGATAAKVTISLPRNLLEFADDLAHRRAITRSEVISALLEKEQEAEVEALMAEGYREWGEENRAEAEEALNITREVILRDA